MRGGPHHSHPHALLDPLATSSYSLCPLSERHPIFAPPRSVLGLSPSSKVLNDLRASCSYPPSESGASCYLVRISNALMYLQAHWIVRTLTSLITRSDGIATVCPFLISRLTTCSHMLMLDLQRSLSTGAQDNPFRTSRGVISLSPSEKPVS